MLKVLNITGFIIAAYFIKGTSYYNVIFLTAYYIVTKRKDFITSNYLFLWCHLPDSTLDNLFWSGNGCSSLHWIHFLHSKIEKLLFQIEP
jgi:hypothetical protein